MQTITVNDLTIRQLKTLGKATGVKGFSKMVQADLIGSIKLAIADKDELQKMVDTMLSPEEKRQAKGNGKADGKSNGKAERTSNLTKEELEAAKLDALMTIAKASGSRMKTEDALRSRRRELNQEVGECKASHKGAMEREVNYEDTQSVHDKLVAVTSAWQEMNDSLEHRRLELQPLKERLSKARTRERKAFEDSRQLKIRF